MSQPKRPANSRKQQRHQKRDTLTHLSHEALEPRQMLAASLGPLSPVNLLDRAVPAQVQVALPPTSTLSHGATGSPQRGQPIDKHGLIIPTTSAAPRTLDGAGNNRANPQWGSTNEQLLRTAPNDYTDGISEMAGADRPSARGISNAIVAQREDSSVNSRNMSAYAYPRQLRWRNSSSDHGRSVYTHPRWRSVLVPEYFLRAIVATNRLHEIVGHHFP